MNVKETYFSVDLIGKNAVIDKMDDYIEKIGMNI